MTSIWKQPHLATVAALTKMHIDTVASQLAGYKRVRHVEFVDEIPRLPSGKALRRTLKEQWLAAH